MANKRVLQLSGATAGSGLTPAPADHRPLQIKCLEEWVANAVRTDGRTKPWRPMSGRNAALQCARIPLAWASLGVELRLIEIGVRKVMSGGMSTTGVHIFRIFGIADSIAASDPQVATSDTQAET